MAVARIADVTYANLRTRAFALPLSPTNRPHSIDVHDAPAHGRIKSWSPPSERRDDHSGPTNPIDVT
jgi:hypothetical protein